jgi:leucyl aminopeptidase
MRVTVTRRIDFKFPEPKPCLVVGVFKDAPTDFGKAVARKDAAMLETCAEQGLITGKGEGSFLLPTPRSNYTGVLVLGLGERDAITAEAVRRAAGGAVESLRKCRAAHVVLSLPDASKADAFVEGLALGQYRFAKYKAKKEDDTPDVTVEEVTVLCEKRQGLDELASRCARVAVMCCHANWARDLANMPANDLTPAELARIAQGIAEEAGGECEVLDEAQMRELGMNALLGVAQGSAQPPRLIVMRYTHSEDARTLAIAGKGVTFDTGGISLKSGAGMHEMKWDMCGAAAVLGAMRCVYELKPSVNVVAVVPAVENMPGHNAQRPGDIVTACNGKTVEVHNTDAEGRLILADALACTVRTCEPDCIVDLATLTGACVAALGHFAAGVIANDDAVWEGLNAAAEATGERLWRLPLWEDYEKLMEGTHADLCNIGPEREAGAVTAGCFLKQFVGDTPWAHVDIAGTAWGVKNVSYLDPKSASGYGVRLLTQWILREAGTGGTDHD